jgi:antitoxin (DNA-binding transcriptional repressor) of toxin-antitoxin stability system
MEASVLDLRKNMREVMSAISRHEHITLTYRGRVCAEIVPVGTAKAKQVKAADLPAFGLWAQRADLAAPVSYVEQLRQPRRF